MIERLSSEDQTSQIAAQFVPLKIDTGSEEWQTWRRQYKYEGRTIPIVMVVRADGEQLYGKSGSLSGEALPRFLLEMLSSAGQIPDARQLEVIQTQLVELRSAIEGNQWRDIGKALRAVKKVGVPGKLGSFAASAVEIDQLVNDLLADAHSRLDALQADAENDVASSAEIEKTVTDYLQAKQEIGQLAFLDKTLSRQLRSIGRSELVKQALAAKRQEEQRQKQSSDAEQPAKQPEFRTWSSRNGKYQVKARLKEVLDDSLQLEKENGEVIEVAIDDLSDEDQQYIRERE